MDSAARPDRATWLPFAYVFERFERRVDGLGDDEHRWAPGSVPTIAWRIAHVADALGARRNWTVLGRDPAEAPAPTTEPATAAEGLAQVRGAFDAWMALLDSLTDGELWAPLGPVAGPYAADARVSYVVHLLDELIHHTAEVALLRDLYAARPMA